MRTQAELLTTTLAELSADELRHAVYARLHGDPAGGPSIDRRSGPDAFEWLSEQYRTADAGLQHRLTAILRDFLHELPDTARWPERARAALLDLIQDCGEALIDDVFRAIRQRTLRDAAGLGPDAHAGLLKCLISNGHHATPEFWLEQFEVLGPAYGALIFSGLIDHGLELAMSHLPQLCADPEARQQVRWLFPHLKDRYGTRAVVDMLDGQRNRLPDETHRLYREDLCSPVASVPVSTPLDVALLDASLPQDVSSVDAVHFRRLAAVFRAYFSGTGRARPAYYPTSPDLAKLGAPMPCSYKPVSFDPIVLFEDLSHRMGLSAESVVDLESDSTFDADAELIVRGHTKPGARVSLAGQPVDVCSDGTFIARRRLRDLYDLPRPVDTGGVTERPKFVLIEPGTFKEWLSHFLLTYGHALPDAAPPDSEPVSKEMGDRP